MGQQQSTAKPAVDRQVAGRGDELVAASTYVLLNASGLSRAKFFLALNASMEVRKEFESKLHEAAMGARRLLTPCPEGEDVEKWEGYIYYFQDGILDGVVSYLRHLSAALQQTVRKAGAELPESGTEDKSPEDLAPAHRRAYFSYSWVENNLGKQITDRQAYEWLTDNGLPGEEAPPELANEFVGYTLPIFETWSKYLRVARDFLGTQKYTKRAGRATGRSVASERDVDHQRSDEAEDS